MRAKLVLGTLGLLWAAACSRDSSVADAGARALDEDGGNGADDTAIVPEGLGVSALAGGNGVLELFALTLRRGESGPELYAALRNVGDVPACSAALSVELFDESGQSMAAGIGGLLAQHFYRRTDGSGAIAACIGPGDVAMTAVQDLPAELAIDQVRSLVYRCPYFALDVVPVAGITISDVEDARSSAGTRFRGTLRNELDVALERPSVTVFPVNRAGRPLGAATSSSDVEIPPGGSWTFETNSVAEPGAKQAAYPAGELAD